MHALDNPRAPRKNRRMQTAPHPFALRPTPREEFLTTLRSRGRLEYKRYLHSPLRYAGGKSLAVGYVIENIPDRAGKIVSPFFGGGSVEIACAKHLGARVAGYDIFDILTAYWRVQLSAPHALAARIGEWRPTKERYQKVKTRLQSHWRGEQRIENETELAAHYWFNHNLSYGPGFLGWMSKIYEQPRRFQNLLAKVRDFRCPNLSVTQCAFETSLPRHRSDFLYCDPPYFLGGDSKMFKGIYPQRNFPVHHNNFDHKKLRDLLHAHQAGFILSYNDCATVREWYRDFEIKEVKWQYTLGQGETRIGKNRIENGSNHHTKESHELLIIKRG